jgi:hypothetical protein
MGYSSYHLGAIILAKVVLLLEYCFIEPEINFQLTPNVLAICCWEFC